MKNSHLYKITKRRQSFIYWNRYLKDTKRVNHRYTRHLKRVKYRFISDNVWYYISFLHFKKILTKLLNDLNLSKKNISITISITITIIPSPYVVGNAWRLVPHLSHVTGYKLFQILNKLVMPVLPNNFPKISALVQVKRPWLNMQKLFCVVACTWPYLKQWTGIKEFLPLSKLNAHCTL